MNNLKIFKNEEFGNLRAIEIEGAPWFIGKDVAEALGYTDTNQAIRKHVDDEDKLSRRFDGSGQRREMTIINKDKNDLSVGRQFFYHTKPSILCL